MAKKRVRVKGNKIKSKIIVYIFAIIGILLVASIVAFYFSNQKQVLFGGESTEICIEYCKVAEDWDACVESCITCIERGGTWKHKLQECDKCVNINGIKEKNEECDDGNVVNGDGCDNLCRIEFPDEEMAALGYTRCAGFYDHANRDDIGPSWDNACTGYANYKLYCMNDGLHVTQREGFFGLYNPLDFAQTTTPPNSHVYAGGDSMLAFAKISDNYPDNPNAAGWFDMVSTPSGKNVLIITPTSSGSFPFDIRMCDPASELPFSTPANTGLVAAIYYSTAPVCGNRIIETTEECDDGDAANNDGCSSSCTVERGWQCSGEPSICNNVCGDGIIISYPPLEVCDDGNTNNGDGCSSACTIDSGWYCEGEPSVCAEEISCHPTKEIAHHGICYRVFRGVGRSFAEGTCDSLLSHALLSEILTEKYCGDSIYRGYEDYWAEIENGKNAVRLIDKNVGEPPCKTASAYVTSSTADVICIIS